MKSLIMSSYLLKTTAFSKYSLVNTRKKRPTCRMFETRNTLLKFHPKQDDDTAHDACGGKYKLQLSNCHNSEIFRLKTEVKYF